MPIDSSKSTWASFIGLNEHESHQWVVKNFSFSTVVIFIYEKTLLVFFWLTCTVVRDYFEGWVKVFSGRDVQ